MSEKVLLVWVTTFFVVILADFLLSEQVSCTSSGSTVPNIFFFFCFVLFFFVNIFQLKLCKRDKLQIKADKTRTKRSLENKAKLTLKSRFFLQEMRTGNRSPLDSGGSTADSLASDVTFPSEDDPDSAGSPPNEMIAGEPPWTFLNEIWTLLLVCIFVQHSSPFSHANGSNVIKVKKKHL